MVEVKSKLLLVREELMALIEEFEPGLHQFWPIKLTLKNGKEYSSKYYGMAILQFRDSFVQEKSEGYRVRTNIIFGDDTKAGMKKLALSKDKIGSAHLWRERILHRPNIFISDALQSEIARRGINFWRHHPVREV